MSVITVGDLSYLPYAQFEDPGLPVRVWKTALDSTGDASGGTNLVQLNLKASGVPPGNIFSLERISVDDDDQSDTAVRLSFDGMELFQPGLNTPVWTILLVPNDADTEATLPLAASLPKLWVGRGAQASVSGTIGFRVTNTLNAELRITAMGYMWTPGAINAPGGARRPVSGVFSN